eukprot:FR739630.1.p1 GENE.FR739630.1~~FR739630.1.p1  ORF type:complete len:103 (-),score=11.63 FR739630.1:605-913(-)
MSCYVFFFWHVLLGSPVRQAGSERGAQKPYPNFPRDSTYSLKQLAPEFSPECIWAWVERKKRGFVRLGAPNGKREVIAIELWWVIWGGSQCNTRNRSVQDCA